MTIYREYIDICLSYKTELFISNKYYSYQIFVSQLASPHRHKTHEFIFNRPN